MKNPKNSKSLFYIILFSLLPAFFVLFSFISAFSSESGLMSKIKKADTQPDTKPLLKENIPLPENIVMANMHYQGGAFFTEERKSQITRYKCSSCHNDKTINIQNAAAISHADIKVTHGEKGKPLSCNTCHSEGDRDYLEAENGTAIDFDHVYDMCGQCHFRQKKDWIGGAHGKRVTYWAGERVVKNCSSCHNPHSPRFEKRWPSTYSVPLK